MLNPNDLKEDNAKSDRCTRALEWDGINFN